MSSLRQRIAWRKASAKYYFRNRKKCLEASKQWRLLNSAKNADLKRRWCIANPEVCVQYARKYRKAFPERVVESRRKYYKNMSPEIRLAVRVRVRVWQALKGLDKSDRTEKLLGCSISHLKRHLEDRFKPGMSWKNYGPVWQIDHIRPCASFDLTRSDHQLQCFHFCNLQPLFTRENQQKHAKW